MLLLVSVAAAHVPHDTVKGMAVPADGATDTPWFTLLDPQRHYLWLRSDDGGAGWDMVGGAMLEQVATGAAHVGHDGVAVLTETSLWWSADAGGTWSESALPADTSWVEGGDTLVLGGEGGLQTTADGVTWTTAWADPVAVLGPHAAVSAGVVLVDRGGWAAAAPVPAGDVTAVADDGVHTYAGTAAGALWVRDDAGWTACGALDGLDVDHPGIDRIASDGATVLVATANTAPYASTDACASWTSPTAAGTVYNWGGPTETDAAWSVLAIAGDTWVVGGWSGLYLSHDEGASWTSPPLVPPDYTRGVAFSSGWPDEARLWTGPYACGVQWTDDEGVTWSAPSDGLEGGNVQAVHADPTDPRGVWAVVGYLAWRSTDGGASWAQVSPDDVVVDDVLRLPDGRLWVVSGAGVRESTDDGTTWTNVELDLGGSLVAAAADGDAVAVTSSDPSAIAWTLDGETWSARTAGAVGEVSPPVPWPPGAPTEMVWGDPDGVHVESAAGSVDVATSPIVALAAAPDGTLLAATQGALLLRSDDGGATWGAFGERLPAEVYALAVRPDWDTTAQLVAGTHDGLFVVDADGTWARLEYQRVDDASTYFQCQGCADPIVDASAGMDSRTPIVEGATVSLRLRGSRLRLTGSGGGAGAIDVTVDGSSLGPVGLAPVGSVLLDAEGLGDGPHDVVLTGLDGSKVALDAVEAWGATTTLLPTLPPLEQNADPCGCHTTTSPGTGLVVVCGAALLRRRRATSSAT